MASANVQNNYYPSYIVRQAHNILHLSASLKPVDNDFNISYSSQINDYSRSLLPIPILCALLGIIGVLIFLISMCVRMCCKPCRCLAENVEDRDFRFRSLTVLFIIFAILMILTNQMVLFGNHYLTEGVDTSHNAVNFIHDLTQTLVNQGNTLISEGDTLQSDLSTAGVTCPTASSLAAGVSADYDYYVNAYQNYVDPIPGRCDNVNDGISTWSYYKDSSLWIVYAVFWTLPVIFAAGLYFQQKWVLQAGISFSGLVMIVVFLLVGVVMVILMGFGDFCMSPIQYTNQLIPRNIYNITAFYLDCQGANPLLPYLSNAYVFVDQYTLEITNLYSGPPPCGGNTYLQQSLGVLQSINNTLNSISSEIGCPPVQYQLSTVINTGLCQQGFEGIYTIWLGQYLTVSCLLAMAIAASLLYQYDVVQWLEADLNQYDPEAPPVATAEGVEMSRSNENSTDNPAYTPGTMESYQNTSQKKTRISDLNKDNYI